MTRVRVTLAFIENHSRRKACYKRRKMGLAKKVEELATLCGVQACVIIYSHFDEDPQIWPTEHSAVMEIITKFKNMAALEQNRKMESQESFTEQRIRKLREQCKKLRQINRYKKIKLFVSECLAGEPQTIFSLAELNEMRWSIYFTIQSIARQIETTKGQSPFPATPIVSLMPKFHTGGLMIPLIQSAGFGNMYNPVMSYTQIPNGMVQNENCPELPVHYPMMMPNQHSTGDFINGYVVNDPQNPTSGMNAMVPSEQFVAASGDFDWISYLFGDEGTDFTGP